MALPLETDLTLVRRTTMTITLTVTESGTPVDLRADAITLLLYPERSSAAALSMAADVATEGINGVAVWQLSAAQTNLTAGVYRLEIVRVAANGDVQLLAVGSALVRERVSADAIPA